MYVCVCGSVLVICHFNIYLTEVGVVHEAGYVHIIRSTECHCPFRKLHLVRFLIIWSLPC